VAEVGGGVSFAELEQAVGGRDDIFDLRTGPRLEHRESIDQDGLIRDQFCGLFELGKRSAGGNASFEHRTCF
jgi:hypothetical protein